MNRCSPSGPWPNWFPLCCWLVFGALVADLSAEEVEESQGERVMLGVVREVAAPRDGSQEIRLLLEDNTARLLTIDDAVEVQFVGIVKKEERSKFEFWEIGGKSIFSK